jgi:hypothetical protein
VVTGSDLVQAHSFERRRLTAAFVAGAPAGPEVGPTRNGRALVAGIAFALVLACGAPAAHAVREVGDGAGGDRARVELARSAPDKYG